MHKIICLLGVFTCALPGFASVDPGLVSLLPAGATAVFGVNAQEARATPFGQYLLADSRWQDSHLQQVMSATGFDPRRDLQSLLVATAGSQNAGTTKLFTVLARGSFNPDKIKAAALQKGFVQQNIAGADAYVSPQNSNGPQTGFTFLQPDVAAFGDLTSLGNVISAQGNPGQGNPDLAQLIAKTGSANDLWFASVGSPAPLAPPSSPNTPGQSAQVLQSITQSSGGLKLGPTALFTFDAIARSDKDATALGDVIRMFASMAQVHRDQTAALSPLGPALDNLNLVTNGSEVLVTTSLPESNLEQLAQMKPPARANATHSRLKANQ